MRTNTVFFHMLACACFSHAYLCQNIRAGAELLCRSGGLPGWLQPRAHDWLLRYLRKFTTGTISVKSYGTNERCARHKIVANIFCVDMQM